MMFMPLTLMRSAIVPMVALIASCAPLVVRPQFLQPGFEIREVGRSGAAVAVISDATLLDAEARRAFSHTYRTYDALSRSITATVLKELGPPSSGLTMNRQVAASLALLNDSVHALRNIEFLKSIGTRYLVHVREIQITRDVHAGMPPPNVYMVALLKVDVWDAESGQILAVFEIDGSNTVDWGDFKGALQSAVTEAARKLGLYLATGSIETLPYLREKSGSRRPDN